MLRVSSLMLLAVLAGCATGNSVQESEWAPRNAPATQPEFFVIENLTDDLVRAYLEIDGRAIWLGRVAAFQKASLRVPAEARRGFGTAQLVVVPIGSPNMYSSLPSLNPTAVRSDAYQLQDMVAHNWRVSGRRITMLMLPRR